MITITKGMPDGPQAIDSNFKELRQNGITKSVFDGAAYFLDTQSFSWSEEDIGPSGKLILIFERYQAGTGALGYFTEPISFDAATLKKIGSGVSYKVRFSDSSTVKVFYPSLTGVHGHGDNGLDANKGYALTHVLVVKGL